MGERVTARVDAWIDDGGRGGWMDGWMNSGWKDGWKEEELPERKER